MIRNREIKGFLDRSPARAVADIASGPEHLRGERNPVCRRRNRQGDRLRLSHRFAQSYCKLRPDGRDHRQALRGASSAMPDLRQQETAKSAPGAAADRYRFRHQADHDQRRISLGRRRAPRLRGIRKHVSPLTGVVRKLERIEADLPMNTNFFAQHNFSAPAMSVDQLRSGLSGGSFGKGSTAEQAEASALMEAIERYSGIFQGDEIRMTRRFTDFPEGDALLSNDVQLFSETQFRDRHLPQPDGSHPIPEPIDPSAKIEWSPVWSLRDKRFKYLPTGLLYFFYRDFHTDSNGCAAGNTREEAIVQGFLELVERDAYAIWWYNRLRRAGGRSQRVRRFLHPRPQDPVHRCGTQGCGCSTSPAISASPPMSRSCIG